MTDKPVYVSTSTLKSIWQEYRIFGDRLEFDTKAFLRGDLRLKNFRPAIKIDWANFLEHVVLDKKEGQVRRVLFTPEDPPAFTDALQEAVSRFQKESGEDL